MENRRRGFTLAELIVGVVVMIVTLGVATMSLRSTDQTPKREAERIAMFLTRLTQKSDRIKMDVTVKMENGKLVSLWNNNKGEEIELSTECNCVFRNMDNNTWTYERVEYPNGVKIDARSNLDKVVNGKLQVDYYYKNMSSEGHRYIKITNDNNGSIKGKQHLEYYVLITSRDVT
ncbi:MAG: type II secretion system protein [Synergistaceae bacterium]|nr:type II secretion system protein [Synergistaceae bacterium]MBQ3398172.1 type II secretion system protein [Synergistaceae bacterium]MBQ6002598.1 type II secretion system protein [Synergistaceae bacterium]MBQ6664480.1 type II secretion system protein [Synergistaceae bacterium]MBQ6981252.1 type II secretion system protein [Synergistaceae bacterium]